MKTRNAVAIVTGASSGIGEASAQRLAAAGYKVYGTSRRAAPASGRAFEMLPLDVTRDPEAFEAAHRELATANLSDLDPPRPVYALLFTHPTPPERIAAGRAWARATVP